MNPISVVGLQRLALVAVAVSLTGCYYMQAARGQLEINRKREPIDEVVVAETTSAQLASQLRLVTEARQFSIDELGLPDNGSYRSYADLERDYVVWNIVAVPEFSLQAKTWCYPIVGCVSYRGYFSEEKAQTKAGALREQGLDVAVGGVAAYSTLGRFDDPVLNTMTHWGGDDLVAVMFHELAHQVLYIKDDTEFNESFATAVEEIGLERWLSRRQQTEKLAAWRERRAVRAEFTELVAATREDLRTIYDSEQSVEAKRREKQARLQEFAAAARQLYASVGHKPPAWLDSELNNARLASTTLYHGRLQEFRDLLEECSGDLPCFYSAATRLAEST
ncbi:MAG: aminopeptidase [Woeseiaceae bacterium]